LALIGIAAGTAHYLQGIGIDTFPILVSEGIGMSLIPAKSHSIHINLNVSCLAAVICTWSTILYLPYYLRPQAIQSKQLYLNLLLNKLVPSNYI